MAVFCPNSERCLWGPLPQSQCSCESRWPSGPYKVKWLVSIFRGASMIASAQLFVRARRRNLRDLSRRVASGRKTFSESASALKLPSASLPANKARQSRGVAEVFQAGGHSGIGGLCLDSSGDMVGFFSEKCQQNFSRLSRGQVKKPSFSS